MELTYRTYTLYNELIAGKVAVATSKEYVVKMTAHFPDLPGLQLPGFSYLQESVKDCIVGLATGNYRVEGNDYLIEVELFNHAWHPDLGLPIRKVELRSKVAYSFNDPDLRFMLDDAAKGYRVYKDAGSRDRRTMLNTPTTGSVLDPDYLLYSDPKKWDTYFESPDAQGNYTAIDRVKTMYAGIESNGHRDYIPATSVGFDPQVYWNGGIPVEVRIIAHISNPAVTLTTPGVIVGPEGWDAGVAGFQYSPKRVYGMAPGTPYYIRTYIKAVRVTGESIDTGDQFEYYSDPVQYTTPEESIKPVLVFAAADAISLTKNSFAMRVAFEYIGDFAVEEAGVCWCPESLNRPPVITDGKATTALRDEFGTDDVAVTGLDSGTIYRLRTYVKLSATQEVVYPSEFMSYHYIRNRGHRYEYGVVTPPPRPRPINMKALVTTSGPAITLGTIVLNELFWAAPDRVSAKITLGSLGGSVTWSMGVCYAKAPAVPTVDSSKVVAVIDRGYYEPNYVDITGLDPASEYNFRAYVTNTAGTSYSDGISLETEPGVERKLSFKILPANKVTLNSAEIGMVVTDADGISSKGIYWKQGIATPTGADNVINGDATAGELKRTINNLLPNTTYTYVGFVILGGLAKYTEPVQFTTLPEPIVKTPTVEIVSVSGITPTSAKVALKVIDNGGADITSLGVCVIIGNFSDKNAPSFYRTFTAAAQQSGEIVINLTELSANTNFKVAAFAINIKGYAYSALSVFNTLAGVQLPSVELLPFLDSASTPTSASVEARITSDGGGTLLRAGVVWSAEPFNATGEPEDIESYLEIMELPNIVQWYPGVKNFNIRINNLSPQSHYYYALFVENGAGYGWTELDEFITPVGDLNETTVLCEETIGDNSITLLATVNSTFDTREVGYMYGTSLNNLKKVKTGTASPFTVIYTNDTIGTYYIRAYVVTSDGNTTVSGTYVLRVGNAIDNTVKFNPPSDTKIKNYQFTFDGVVRRWRRNKENNWERVYDSLTVVSDATQQQKAKQAAPSPVGVPEQNNDQIIAALTSRIAELEKRVGFSSIEYLTAHFSRTAYIEAYDGISGRFVIQLNENFKFSVDINLLSESLTVYDEQGKMEFEDLSWNAEPNTREIWWDFDFNSPEHSQIIDALAAVEAGSRFIIFASDKGNIRRAWIDQFAVIFSDDIYFPHRRQELTSVVNELEHNIEYLQKKIPQKYYECMFQQYLTNNPVAVQLSNTITPDSAPVWTRVGQGIFQCDFGGTAELFVDAYCVQANQNYASSNSQDSFHIELDDVGNTTIVIATIDNASGSYSDNQVSNPIYLKFIAL